MKPLVLALAIGLLSAGGALAQGPPPHPPGQGPPPGQDGQGSGPGQGAGRAQGPPRPNPGDKRFRDELVSRGYTCGMRPAVLHGTLAAVAADSLTVHARTDVAVKLITSTQIHRNGPANVASLVVGDRLMVAAAVCKTQGSTAPTLVARLVDAHPAADTTPDT